MPLETSRPTPPQPMGNGLKVRKLPYCLRIVFVIGKYAYIFRVGGGVEFFSSEIFHGNDLLCGGKFPGG